MTLVSKTPLLGIVYKLQDNNRTYTSWYHESHYSTYPFHESPSMWLSERLNLEYRLKKKNIRSDRIMCIVRAK